MTVAGNPAAVVVTRVRAGAAHKDILQLHQPCRCGGHIRVGMWASHDLELAIQKHSRSLLIVFTWRPLFEAYSLVTLPHSSGLPPAGGP